MFVCVGDHEDSKQTKLNVWEKKRQNNFVTLLVALQHQETAQTQNDYGAVVLSFTDNLLASIDVDVAAFHNSYRQCSCRRVTIATVAPKTEKQHTQAHTHPQ